MVPADIFRRVRQIEITSGRLVDEALAGAYHSVFKGRGMACDSVRPYQPGDEVRDIDWNVTSRTGSLHVKQFVEERELTLLLLIDASRSTVFGSGQRAKQEVAAELAALLALAATRNNDRVGAALFTGEVERYIPPRKGLRHVLRVVREVLAFEPRQRNTDVGTALAFAARVLKKRSIVFCLSDFIGGSFEDDLRSVSRRHELVAVSIRDQAEWELPGGGWVRLVDSESGRACLLPVLWPGVRAAHDRAVETEVENLRLLFRRHGVDHVEVRADGRREPPEAPLLRYFRRRAHRLRGTRR